MPIDKEDFLKASLATLIPGAAGLACYGVFSTDMKNTLQWWKDLKKPSWAPTDICVYSTMDTLVSLPLGCASFLVYKHGGGFGDDATKLALAAYGTNLALCVLSTPLIVKKKNTKLVLGMTGMVFATTLATAILFYKVHKTAGYMLIPSVSWSAFYTLLMTMIVKEEAKSKPKA